MIKSNHRIRYFLPFDGDEVGDHVVLVGDQPLPGTLILLYPWQLPSLVQFDPERVDWGVLQGLLFLGNQVGLHGIQGEHQATVVVHSSRFQCVRRLSLIECIQEAFPPVGRF